MGMGRVWAKKFEFEENPFLGKNIFDFWGNLTPKMHAHLAIHPCPPFPHAGKEWELIYLHIFLSAVCSTFTILELLGTSLTFLELLCIPHPHFYNFLHFPHDWEVIFAKISAWALGLMFLLLFSRPGIHFVMPSELEKRQWFLGVCVLDF